MPIRDVPIVKLELESMRHTLRTALLNHSALLNESIQNAVDAYCTPENLEHIIHLETNTVLTQVIKEEVKNWFTYGEGRKVIKAAVIERLEQNTSYTALDFAEDED